MDRSDSQLVKDACRNDMGAYRELIERHKKKIYYTSLSVVKNHQDAEDILQETLLKAMRSLHTLKSASGFSSWICRIAYNRSIDLIRKRKREVNPSEEDGLSIFDTLESDHYQSNPEKGIHARQISSAISEVLASLPESQKRAFELKHLSQMSIRDIAAITGSSESTVKTNIFRAVQKMRSALSEFVEKNPVEEIDRGFQVST